MKIKHTASTPLNAEFIDIGELCLISGVVCMRIKVVQRHLKELDSDLYFISVQDTIIRLVTKDQRVMPFKATLIED